MFSSVLIMPDNSVEVCARPTKQEVIDHAIDVYITPTSENRQRAIDKLEAGYYEFGDGTQLHIKKVI